MQPPMMFDGPVPGIPGATIRRVDVLPDQLADGAVVYPNCSIAPGRMLLTLPGHGRLFARDGDTIELTIEPGADEGLITLHLNGSARGALIHQRGELPLHAATLIPPGGDPALAICGPSGAGKSTLAAELSRRGWILVADDTTRVVSSANGVTAWPSRPNIKLWRDACEAAGIDVASLRQVAAAFEKYYLPVPGSPAAVALGTVVELVLEDTDNEALLTAGEKMGLVSRHTYRPAYIRPLNKMADHFRIASRTVTACRMFKLTSDRSVSVRAFADSVEKTVFSRVPG